MRNFRKWNWVLAVAVGVAGLSSCSSTAHDDTSATPTTVATSGFKVLTPRNTSVLESGLNSPDKVAQEDAWAPQLRMGERSKSVLLPKGATLTVDRTTFAVEVTNPALAHVTATVTGPAKGVFTLRLCAVDGQWLIYETKKVK